MVESTIGESFNRLTIAKFVQRLSDFCGPLASEENATVVLNGALTIRLAAVSETLGPLAQDGNKSNFNHLEIARSFEIEMRSLSGR